MGVKGELAIAFMRAPEKGRVKTRLAKGVGEEKALIWYQIFSLHMLSVMEASSFPFCIHFCPPEGEELLREWLGDHEFIPQVSGDLGARMAEAFTHAFEQGYSRVVLVGTDVPGAKVGHFNQAFAALKQGDAVIGPSLDGGYWLIGFTASAFDPHIFSSMEWGHPRVGEITRARLAEKKLSVSLLSPLGDVDTLSDLQAFYPHPVLVEDEDSGG